MMLGVLLSSFFVQSLIPVGYMPASIKSGSIVELCPEGMSAEWMMALLGHHHAHHSPDKPQFAKCDLGGGLAASALVADFSPAIQRADGAAVEPSRSHVFVPKQYVLGHRSRAPPFDFRFS